MKRVTMFVVAATIFVTGSASAAAPRLPVEVRYRALEIDRFNG